MQQIFDLEAMKDLHQLFSRINQSKFAVKAGEQAVISYAFTINQLASLPLDDTERGEELSCKALEQVRLISNGKAAQKELEGYKKELEGLLARLRTNPHVIVIGTDKPNLFKSKEAV